MKRTILIIAGIFLPLSAMAMKPLNETDLSNIACQSGVSIMFDVTMNIHFDIIAWGDPDGCGSVQSTRPAGGNSVSQGGASESITCDPSEMPHVVRVEPDTMTLTPNGTEMLLYKDIFNNTVLSKP